MTIDLFYRLALRFAWIFPTIVFCYPYLCIKLIIMYIYNVTAKKCIWKNLSAHPIIAICESVNALTLSQCTLAGPVYIGMPLEFHWLTQCALGYLWATQRILAGYTGTPLEKLSWNSPRWNVTGENLTFAAYTGTPLEGLWQPTQAPTHIIKHAE